MSLHELSKRTAPQDLIQFAQKYIQAILRDVSEVNLVMLCSSDGFELASVHKKDVENHGKLAAVSSSILAMIHAFMNEINFTGCQSITLDADNGKAVMASIQHPNFPMLIVTLSSKEVLLGQLLYATKKASTDIAAYKIKI
ncbi:roadblock/LC7 domain-containing protein [Acinetobacter pseudolwoffii]|uniref:roadblock/LC7 domain-containing protein n=1 Tax=Acinetobacter pseudolwoffii TaxID=2053287 RepID=UPI00209CF3EB|nr:roadblock/LC7 domain-containing protein [Acinetobacter pseudolwoffii]MCP0910337.1 roadblock/LC7 domain-containing protein [Acinetobacter pseudolwoffii]